MNLKQLFQQIENYEVEFTLGVASGFGTFQDILQRLPIYHELLQVVTSYLNAKTVKEHIKVLLETPFDQRHSHPHDTSIAIYVLAVVQHHPELLRFLIEDDISPIGLYWTRYAVRLLDEKLRQYLKPTGDVSLGYLRSVSFFIINKHPQDISESNEKLDLGDNVEFSFSSDAKNSFDEKRIA